MLVSSTYVRPKDENIVSWSVRISEEIKDVIAEHCPDDVLIGIEGIEAPKGFSGGKKAPINPAYIIDAGIVLGAIAKTFPNAVIVRPGKNGSRGDAFYPDSLKGRRPKDLPGTSVGSSTRNHEKSAYDVAGEAIFLKRIGMILDGRPV